MRHSHARAASSMGAVFDETNMSRLVSTRPGTPLIQSRARPARFSPGAPRLKPPGIVRTAPPTPSGGAQKAVTVLAGHLTARKQAGTLCVCVCGSS